ncbi:hypothetical protein D3C76_936990 [compost metagenome]
MVASLFPEDVIWMPENSVDSESTDITFGRSWLFDFEAGDFILSPTRKISTAADTAAWVMWCEKTVRTPRYRHLIYSRDYGQEYDDLIGRGYSRAVLESEIERMTTEALMVDPRTAGVDSFTFEWSSDACQFTCNVKNVRDETITLEGGVSV